MKTSVFLLLSLIASTSVFSQSGADTVFLNASLRNTINLYAKALGTQARLYNGSKYQAPEHTVDQHPFFSSEDWITGSVYYDGEYFQEVPLMYDLQLGALITEHYPSGHPIQLVHGKLRHFSIADHFFEKIENESVGNSLPGSGFYDILYNGKTKVIAKRQKFLREQIVATTIERSFEEKNRYFIFKNGVFFPVKSKGSVLKLMTDKKQELKRLLKSRKLPFYANRELLMIILAEHYDQ